VVSAALSTVVVALTSVMPAPALVLAMAAVVLGVTGLLSSRPRGSALWVPLLGVLLGLGPVVYWLATG
jgi:hypothetical protein